MDSKKRYVLGYFEDENSLDVKHFKKLAKALKEDCIFYAGYGEVWRNDLIEKILGSEDNQEKLAVCIGWKV